MYVGTGGLNGGQDQNFQVPIYNRGFNVTLTTDQGNPPAPGGKETRPKNIAVNYIIKY